MTTATTFAWLEITGKCQLECTHCYADSGPTGSHGQMRRQDWERVIDELAEAGVTMVQFIGGEPMLHPDLGALIDRATTRGLQVEVYSNLVHVPASIWPLLERPGSRSPPVTTATTQPNTMPSPGATAMHALTPTSKKRSVAASWFEAGSST